MIRLCNLLIFISCYFASSAQIADLHDDGVLIVRLESGNAKLKAIQAKIEAGNTSSRYWEEQLEEVKSSLRHKNKAVILAFEENYRFSEVLYLYDIDSKKLKVGQTEGIFLNSDLKYDKNIQLNKRSFLVASEEQSDAGAEGIYLLNSDLTRLQKPLPHFIKLNSIFFLFNQFTSTEAAIEKMYLQAAKRLNNKLRNYLLKKGRSLEVD